MVSEFDACSREVLEFLCKALHPNEHKRINVKQEKTISKSPRLDITTLFAPRFEHSRSGTSRCEDVVVRIRARITEMIRGSTGGLPVRFGVQSRTHCLEQRVNPFARRSELRAVQTQCSAVSDREITDTTKETLDQFIAWACANGVQGFGQADSQACLYVGSDGERGVLAQKPIPKGEIIVQAPLRIALADHPFDKESNELLPSDASWSTRLACRLLRECNLGATSLWYPYVSVLPQQVPTPVHWGEALVSRIKYQQAANHCFESHWVVESALSKLSGKAIGVEDEELTEEQADSFRWACALVHSRTFATAAQDGGVGVRVMVPVLDMFNHAGDEVRNLLTSRSRACDNCRWQAVAPENNSSNEWVMQVIATADILEGDELCFSYGERSNDDFFVHYGFVPLRNPRDEVILFESIESALDWYALESGLPVAVGPPDAALPSNGNGVGPLPVHDAAPESNAWSGMGGEVVPNSENSTAASSGDDGAASGIESQTNGGAPEQSEGQGEAPGEEAASQEAEQAAADAAAAAAEHERRYLVDALRQIALETHAQMDMRLEEEGIFEKPGQGPPLGPNDPRRLAVRAGCYVTPELMIMFEKVAGEHRELAEAAVARRAWALLRDWGGEGLRQDLALLAVHAAQHGRSTAEDSEERFWEFLLVHYHEAIPGFCKANGIRLKADVTELQEIPTTDIDPKELVEAYMKTAGESSVRPISYNEYLVSTLMANKRMILWDVLLSGKGLALDAAELGPLRV